MYRVKRNLVSLLHALPSWRSSLRGLVCWKRPCPRTARLRVLPEAVIPSVARISGKPETPPPQPAARRHSWLLSSSSASAICSKSFLSGVKQLLEHFGVICDSSAMSTYLVVDYNKSRSIRNVDPVGTEHPNPLNQALWNPALAGTASGTADWLRLRQFCPDTSVDLYFHKFINRAPSVQRSHPRSVPVEPRVPALLSWRNCRWRTERVLRSCTISGVARWITATTSSPG